MSGISMISPTPKLFTKPLKKLFVSIVSSLFPIQLSISSFHVHPFSCCTASCFLQPSSNACLPTPSYFPFWTFARFPPQMSDVNSFTPLGITSLADDRSGTKTDLPRVLPIMSAVTGTAGPREDHINVLEHGVLDSLDLRTASVFLAGEVIPNNFWFHVHNSSHFFPK